MGQCYAPKVLRPRSPRLVSVSGTVQSSVKVQSTYIIPSYELHIDLLLPSVYHYCLCSARALALVAPQHVPPPSLMALSSFLAFASSFRDLFIIRRRKLSQPQLDSVQLLPAVFLILMLSAAIVC